MSPSPLTLQPAEAELPNLNTAEFDDLDSMGESNRTLPRLDPRHEGLPDPMSMAQWRASADARMEAALASLDQDLVDGLDPHTAARVVLARFMNWSRRSIAPFTTTSGERLVHRLRGEELERWNRLADECAGSAARDPQVVDRFLRVWLAVVHEATATGFASLYACSPG